MGTLDCLNALDSNCSWKVVWAIPTGFLVVIFIFTIIRLFYFIYFYDRIVLLITSEEQGPGYEDAWAY